MSTYTLRDFNQLAYEFAIRNPNVIVLLKKCPEDSSKELLKYGIDTKYEIYDDEIGKNIVIDSYDNLYLGYDHLEKVREIHNIKYEYDEFLAKKECCRRLCHPSSKTMKPLKQTSELKELTRIHRALMAEGGPQIRRLIQGEPFYRYDQVTFQNATKYSLDPTTKAKKIISSDIAFVKKWIKRANYLQLLPQYANSFFIVNKDL